MTIFDVILLVLVGGFVLFGLWFGFIHTLGSLIGTIFGTFFAGWLHAPIAAFLSTFIGDTNKVYFFTYVILFILISRVFGFLFFLLDSVMKIFTRLPFLKQVDKLLGMLVGLVEGVLVVSLALILTQKYNLGLSFQSALESSKVGIWLMTTGTILVPLLPKSFDDLRAIKTNIGL